MIAYAEFLAKTNNLESIQTVKQSMIDKEPFNPDINLEEVFTFNPKFNDAYVETNKAATKLFRFIYTIAERDTTLAEYLIHGSTGTGDRISSASPFLGRLVLYWYSSIPLELPTSINDYINGATFIEIDI